MPLILTLLACGLDAATIEGAADAPAGSDVDTSSAIDWSDEPEAADPCALEGGALPVGEEGAFIEQGAAIDAARSRCEQALHAGAGAAGSTLRISLEGWGGDVGAALAVFDLAGSPLADWTALAPGDAVSFSPTQSGEFLIYLAPEITDADANTYRLALSCDAGCDRGYTRHPLVLMHGAAGTDAFLDVLDYWKDLDEALPASGYHVEIPAVAALDSVADRAVEWSAHLDALEAAGVGRRFNLIAHSLGGLDARYLVGGLGEGERIASITTIGTPHRGTVVADLYAGAVDLSLFDGILLDAVAEAMVSLIGLEGDELTAMIVDMSTAAMADFNDEILDDPDVYYRSWAGRSCSALDWTCQSETGGEVISSFFAATWSLIWLVEGDNDGLVSLDSAAWGDYRGELPVDHLGEVGWELDLLQADFDHVAFYLSEAEALAGEGL